MPDDQAVVHDVRILTMQNVKQEQLVMWLPDYAPTGSSSTVYRITKLNKKTVTIEAVGGGRQYRASPYMLVDAPAEAAAAAEALPTVPTPVGAVVTISGPGWSRPAGELFSVKTDGDTTVAVARLGGNDGRYFPKIPRRMLTVVPLCELAAALTLDPGVR
jgi:hypothetical protein